MSRATDVLSLPAGIVTGIGSLPFQSAATAIQAVAASAPDVPFGPQCLGSQSGRASSAEAWVFSRILLNPVVRDTATTSGKAESIRQFKLFTEALANWRPQMPWGSEPSSKLLATAWSQRRSPSRVKSKGPSLFPPACFTTAVRSYPTPHCLPL